MKLATYVLIALMSAEAILSAALLINMYVPSDYYMTYTLNLWNGMTTRGFSGINGYVSLNEELPAVLSPISSLSILYIREETTLGVKIIELEGNHTSLVIEGLSLNSDGLASVPDFINSVVSKLPKGNYLAIMYLKTLKVLQGNAYNGVLGYGSKLLSAIAYVNYGGVTHEVILDSPMYLLSDPQYYMSDAIVKYKVRVEPSQLVTFKVVSIILYPILLIPASILTYIVMRDRRSLGTIMMVILAATLITYIVGLTRCNPTSLITYVMGGGPYSKLKVVNKTFINVFGIRKPVVTYKASEVIKLSDLIKPYEVKAIEMLAKYLGCNDSIVISASPDQAIIKVTCARKVGNNTYELSISNLSNAKLIIKQVNGVTLNIKYVNSEVTKKVIYVYIGLPVKVNECLFSWP